MTSEAKTQAIVRVDPQALLTRALENNATIETLQKLVELAEHVREIQAKEAWHRAMAEFQRRVPPIKKDSTAKVATIRSQYSYSYAQLGDILDVIRPIMGELGLTVTWDTDTQNNRVIVSCRVSHELGHTETSGKVSMPIPDDAERGGGNACQRVGSSLTYARRYSLLCVTGLCPEDDDDARGTDKPAQPKSAPSQTKPTPPPAAPTPEPPATDPAPVEVELPSVDDWKARYEAANDLQAYAKLEADLILVWSKYNKEERAALKVVRDKRKVFLLEAAKQQALPA